jgi:NADH-quinone oxidoreductase subunit A
MSTVDYAPILVMVALAGFLVVVFLLGSVFLGPRLISKTKLMPFECGHPSRGNPNRRFAVKFYGIALLFLLFDVEAVFLYPWAVTFNALGLYALAEMAIFLGMLILAFLYVWAKGGLEWE